VRGKEKRKKHVNLFIITVKTLVYGIKKVKYVLSHTPQVQNVYYYNFFFHTYDFYLSFLPSILNILKCLKLFVVS
jgi:hypothetical protein